MSNVITKKLNRKQPFLKGLYVKTVQKKILRKWKYNFFLMSKINANVMFLGQSFGGRSVLINRMVRHKYEQQGSTVGIADRKITYRYKNSEYSVTFYDAPEIDMNIEITKMYFRMINIAVVAYNSQDEKGRNYFEHWYEVAKDAIKLYEREDKIPIIIAVTKSENISDELKLEITKFADTIGSYVVFTSSLSGMGVNKLESLILHIACAMLCEEECELPSFESDLDFEKVIF